MAATQVVGATGFRRDIMVLHLLSELMEKHPETPRPGVSFGSQYSGDQTQTVNWFMMPNFALAAPKPKDLWVGDTYQQWQAATKELQRVDLEQRITTLVAAIESLAGPIQWEKNDPTEEAYAYALLGSWQDASFRIATPRESVCQKVVVLETEREEEVPDPEVIEAAKKAAPLVKVTIKDQITEWQCNEVIAAATAPQHIRTVQAVL